MLEKIWSIRIKQTTIPDAFFVGTLMVNLGLIGYSKTLVFINFSLAKKMQSTLADVKIFMQSAANGLYLKIFQYNIFMMQFASRRHKLYIYTNALEI